MRARVRRRPLSDMNVIPYIDVMLVLLIIFMVTAPLLQQGVEVQLPKASAKALPPQAQPPMIVSVDRKGVLYLNISDSPRQTIEPGVLALRLGAELQRTPDRKVLLRGDADASYGIVVHTLALLQKAGVPQVGLMTDTPGAS